MTPEATNPTRDGDLADRPLSTVDPQAISEGRTTLGIELGSSRIKAVLIGADHEPLATGAFAWENQLVDRLWTYSLEAAWQGIQACYRDLAANVFSSHGVQLRHGRGHRHLGDDARLPGLRCRGDLLVPFRTWRNTNTGPAAEQLSEELDYNIPHRWSVAHLYQAILNGEDHVSEVDYLTTLAGYIHWQLTGEKILGIGDASGMFPIDITAGDYDASMVTIFNRMAAEAGVPLDLATVLPTVQSAGQPGRRTHRRRSPASGPHRPAAERCAPVPTRRRRRYRHGRHQLRRPPHRQRQRRHQHLRHGRARTRAEPSTPRAGSGHHSGR